MCLLKEKERNDEENSFAFGRAFVLLLSLAVMSTLRLIFLVLLICAAPEEMHQRKRNQSEVSDF
jgi:hypothetical protein